MWEFGWDSLVWTEWTACEISHKGTQMTDWPQVSYTVPKEDSKVSMLCQEAACYRIRTRFYLQDVHDVHHLSPGSLGGCYGYLHHRPLPCAVSAVVRSD